MEDKNKEESEKVEKIVNVPINGNDDVSGSENINAKNSEVVIPAVESNTYMAREKKSHKKKSIGIILLIFVIALVFGGIYLHDYLKFKESIAEDWGQTYYIYLKNVKNNDKAKDVGIFDDMENAKLDFYEVEGIDDPVMVLSYTKDKESRVNVYFIEDEYVNALVYYEKTDVEFLYNILTEDYSYYVHIDKEDSDTYAFLAEQLNNMLEEETDCEEEQTDCVTYVETHEYSFEKDEKETITDADGNEISLLEFDRTFVVPDVKKSEDVSYDVNFSEKELKKAIMDAIDNYQEQDELLTSKVKDDVESKVIEVKDIEAKIEQANKEIFVPDVSGMTVVEAETVLKDSGLEVATDTVGIVSAEYEEGIVVQTIPSSGTKRRKGTTVTIYVSTGDLNYVIENYTGKNYLEVKAELEALGIQVLVEKKDVDDEKIEENTVISQMPAAGEKVSQGDFVTLYIPNVDVTYPDFTNGYTVEEVEDFCSLYGVVLEKKYQQTSSYSTGSIIHQSRISGSKIVAGETLTITIAS